MLPVAMPGCHGNRDGKCNTSEILFLVGIRCLYYYAMYFNIYFMIHLNSIQEIKIK